MIDAITLADYEKAEAQVRAQEGRTSFVVHATIYVLVNILLIVINLMFVPGFLWFLFPLIGWGIGLTMHYLFAVQFERQETEEWQARVERRAVAMHRQP
jgi:2TM domain-containing protein